MSEEESNWLKRNMKTQVYNLKGQVVGDIELSDAVFNSEWNPDLVHQALRTQMANARQPWSHAKGRAEVSGGGKKPWRQKGTGRARHGSIRSPIWIGGGVAHGPLKTRDYSLRINKKMLRAAIHSALSKKLADEQIKIVDTLKFENLKTKEVAQSLKTLVKNGLNALLIPVAENKEVNRVSRNIPKVKAIPATALNVKEILQYKTILIDKDAVKEIK